MITNNKNKETSTNSNPHSDLLLSRASAPISAMPKFDDHECTLLDQEEEVVKQYIESGLFISLRRAFRSACMVSRSHPQTSRYFKSNAACRVEKIRHLLRSYLMIHPFSKLNLIWEFFMFGLFSIQFAMIPIDASLVILEKGEVSYVTKVVLDVLQLVDIIKLFFTGYYDQTKSKVILDCCQVTKHYLFTYFFVDILSCSYSFLYPIPWVDTKSKLSTQKLLVFIRFLNRLKILRLPRWLSILELFRQFMGYSSYLFKGIKVILIFLVITFWAFSINFFVENYIETFVDTHDKDHGHDDDDIKIYECYYDATLKLLQISYGEYELNLLMEYFTAIFFLCFGVALQMFVFAQILQVWTKYASAENRHLSLHKQFKEYMTFRELPMPLRKRVFSYFHFKFHREFFKESDINNMISPLLQQEILMHVTRNDVEKVEFFRHLPENILLKVVSQLKTEVFLPGDVIISAGSTGSSMFFIYHGTVAVFTPTGTEICHLEDGSHFGEIALVLSETRVATVIAITPSELFMLKRSDFLSVIEPFPELKEQLMAVATERLQNVILQSQ